MSSISEHTEDDNLIVNSDCEENEEIPSQSQSALVDKYNAIFILFYLLGMATLLPWNFFITAHEYWMFKLRDLNSSSSTTNATTPLQLGFTSYLCVTSLVPSTVVLVINAFFGHNVSFKFRIAGGLFSVIVFFTITTAFVELNTDTWQMVFYYTTLASAFLINVVSSIFQGGVCGLAGKFPSRYISAVISGQALGGIFASTANVVSIALGASPIESAFMYFVAADVTLALAFVLYLVLSSTEFFLHFSTSHTQTKFNDSRHSASLNQMDDEVLIIPPANGISYRRVLRQIWPYLFSVALTYVVTLSLFPAVSVLVYSEHRGRGYVWNDIYFTPVACFLLMNVADYIGRACSAVIPLPKTGIWTCSLSVLRIVFIPLMILCNAQPRQHLPVMFESDASFVLIMTLFALSNGYLSTVCFSMAPKLVSKEEQETAGSLMAAALGIGLALGGGLSSALVHIL